MTTTYTIYLALAAWKDLKYRKIPMWLYIIFGLAGMAINFLRMEIGWLEVLASLLPGALLLLLTKCSRGAVGAGDGLFFLVSAVYLGFWNTIELLLYGLIFCSTCCLGMLVWGIVTGVDVRKWKLPFLPFLLPAWMFMGLW